MTKALYRSDVTGPGWTEADRLAALANYEILDTLPERDFDDIATLTAHLIGAPIAVVNLIDSDRQWFKAELGLGIRETKLDVSICARILLQPGVTVIPDLIQDPRFDGNPLVQGKAGLRFYAGSPIVTPAGLPLGTLCVLDTAPRPTGLTDAQSAGLAALSRQVMSLLELRRSVAESRAAQAAYRDSEARLAAIFAQATVGLSEIDLSGRFVRVNQEQCRLLGHTEAELLAGNMLDMTDPEDLDKTRAAVAGALTGGRPARLVKRFRRPNGDAVWAEIGLTRLDHADGTPRSILSVAVDLTERMAAEDRVKLSEETLRLATDVAEVGTWDLNPVTNEVTLSSRARAMFGITADPPVSMAEFFSGLHPDDLSETSAAFLRALDPARRATYDAEYRIIGPEGGPGRGKVRWVAAKGRGLFDAQGRCIRALGTAVDITLRKLNEERLGRSEAMLADSEAKFRAITDSIDQMVWSTRADGTDDFYNQRWYEYTGTPNRSLGGDAWNGTFHPDDEVRARDTWRHSLNTGEPYRIEYRLRHHSGQYRWVLGRAQAIRDTAGQIVRWYGTCTEIEEIVQARDVLARSRRELEREVDRRTAELDQVWRNAQDLLLVVDSDGVFRAANPAWMRMLGWPPDEIVGHHVLEFIHPDDVASTQTALPDAIDGRLEFFENRLKIREGGYRTISWLLALHEGLIYATGRDVTAERAAAAALAATQEQLRQAQKMEAVGQLTGGIAHDFNNMLTVVIGSLDLLARRLAPEAARERRYVESALEGARRAALLTQRLLAFARQQPLQPVPVDVNGLVDGMSDLLRQSLGGDIRLETRLSRDLWRTHADPNQLENIILNLAVNGRDAMSTLEHGGVGAIGCLTLETTNIQLGQDCAEANPDTLPGDYVLINVSDTGHGMTEAVKARAFDPFFTTKDVGRGTGLGLSQVYGFVKQSGGHVKLRSEPGRGTSVEVYLPRLIAEPAKPSGAQVPDTPRSRNAETVLVVEDDVAVRRFSVDALTTLGYRVLEADGAAAGLQILDTTPGIALLFTDVVMPDVNGRQLADEARRRHPDLKVLFTTGNSHAAIVPDTEAEIVAHVLSKPFTVADLAVKVRGIFDR